jgi:hypothetical protein
MPQVGFEPTTPVFERARTAHALDRTATVIGCLYIIIDFFNSYLFTFDWLLGRSIDIYVVVSYRIRTIPF